jgi:SAM-dependent methyltransferase
LTTRPAYPLFSPKTLWRSSQILFRRLWMKYVVRIGRTLYADAHHRMDLAYRVSDPWSLTLEKERFRYDKTAEAIDRIIGPVETALEIGCGEGYHTQRLLDQCGSVDCIELSARAIARAKARCPRARFFSSCFPEVPDGLRPRYDLVIAAEILYYIADIAAAIRVMNQLGRFCLASIYDPEVERVRRFFEPIPGVTIEHIEHPECSWTAYIWESPSGARALENQSG